MSFDLTKLIYASEQQLDEVFGSPTEVDPSFRIYKAPGIDRIQVRTAQGKYPAQPDSAVKDPLFVVAGGAIAFTIWLLKGREYAVQVAMDFDVLPKIDGKPVVPDVYPAAIHWQGDYNGFSSIRVIKDANGTGGWDCLKAETPVYRKNVL